jgi:acetyl esterase/lipase
MAIVYDVAYGEADREPLLLDYLRPDPMPGTPIPAIVWIHGGGWEAGDKRVDLADSLGPLLVQDGFFALSINYRLSGQAIFPAQIHDAKAAIRWLRANAEELGIDPDRIGVWGHSAGGHLSALLGTSGDAPELEGESGSPGYSSRVQAVVPVSPPSDFLAIPPGWTNEEPRRATSKLVGGPLEERLELVRLANPITHVRPDAPPFLIIHGEADQVVPVEQAQLLYDALVRVRTEATIVRLPGADHMLAAPERGITADDAWADVGQRALGFFRTHLRA